MEPLMRRLESADTRARQGTLARMELCVYPSPAGPQPAGHTEGALPVCTTPERRRPHANGSVGAVIGPASWPRPKSMV